MKKKTGSILLSCNMALVCALFFGCSEDYFEEEDFGYYYVESEDCYAAVHNWLHPEDKLFVPAYYCHISLWTPLSFPRVLKTCQLHLVH